MRSKRAYINILLSYFMQFCATISGFVVARMILLSFGSEINGFINSINQFLGYFALVEGGIGTASIIALYKPFSTDDHDGIKNIYDNTSIFLHHAGIIYVIFLVVLAALYPLAVNSNINSFDSVLLIFTIGIGRVIELSFCEKFRVMLTADQRIGIYSLIQTLGYFLNVSLVVLAVKVGVGIIGIETLLMSVYLVRALFLYYFCKARYSYIFCNKLSNIKKKYKRIPQQSAALVHQIASMIAYNTDMVVLTLASSLSSVSVYSVYAIVFNGLSTFLSVLQNVLSPAFGDLIAREEKGTLYRSFSIYQFIYYAIGSVMTIGVILFIKPFIRLYTSGVSDIVYWNDTVALLFVLIFFLNQIRLPGSALINAAGHLKQTQIFFVSEAAINLIISVILVKPLGIVGCLIGTVFSGVCRFFFVTLYPYFRILHFSLRKMFLRVLYNGTLCFLAWGLRDLLNSRITSFVDFFLYGIIVALLVVLFEMGICFFFDRAEFENTSGYLKIILKKSFRHDNQRQGAQTDEKN